MRALGTFRILFRESFTKRYRRVSILHFLAAFGIAALLIPMLNRMARRIDWVDIPDQRKRHLCAVPLTGGVAMLSACAVVMLGLRDVQPNLAGLALGSLLLVVVGIIDDWRPLRARLRISAQIAAALAAIYFDGTRLVDLGQLFGPFTLALGFMAVPFTVFGIVGVINALNLSDGVDGLAGGLAWVALFWFLMVVLFGGPAGALTGSAQLIALLVTVMGAIAGFLAFNMRTPWRARAEVFMGDSGSTFLGFVLAWLAVRTSSASGAGGLPPVFALWILAIPLFDTVSCMLRRVASGVTPMTPDRRHLHHLLLALGLTAGQAVLLLHGAAFLLGMVGYAAWRLEVPQYHMFWALMTTLVLCHWAIQRAWAWVERTRPIGARRVA